jgi:hypothetical protein
MSSLGFRRPGGALQDEFDELGHFPMPTTFIGVWCVLDGRIVI